MTKPQLDILIASAFVRYVPFPGQSVEDILWHLMFNSHYFNKTFQWNDFSFLESVGCGKLRDVEKLYDGSLRNVEKLAEIFKIRLNNTDLNIEEMQNDTRFQTVETIWDRSCLCIFDLNLIGSYIGLKY
ncbi:MAG: hypothetical protein IJT08_01190 [Alphaproteobacteria bacterium]|nr:hypothetical protein [Alphaproteobacteria bacterium]